METENVDLVDATKAVPVKKRGGKRSAFKPKPLDSSTPIKQVRQPRSKSKDTAAPKTRGARSNQSRIAWKDVFGLKVHPKIDVDRILAWPTIENIQSGTSVPVADIKINRNAFLITYSDLNKHSEPIRHGELTGEYILMDFKEQNWGPLDIFPLDEIVTRSGIYCFLELNYQKHIARVMYKGPAATARPISDEVMQANQKISTAKIEGKENDILAVEEHNIEPEPKVQGLAAERHQNEYNEGEVDLDATIPAFYPEPEQPLNINDADKTTMNVLDGLNNHGVAKEPEQAENQIENENEDISIDMAVPMFNEPVEHDAVGKNAEELEMAQLTPLPDKTDVIQNATHVLEVNNAQEEVHSKEKEVPVLRYKSLKLTRTVIYLGTMSRSMWQFKNDRAQLQNCNDT